MDNAVKYSPGSSAIWIEAAREQDCVAIRVRDSGLGIPPKEQEQIYRKFFRGSAAKVAGVKGTGIGLAMVQHIIQAHGGKVRLESAPGAGSTFTIVLPASRNNPAP
jgi:signal transduction histidine kinase